MRIGKKQLRSLILEEIALVISPEAIGCAPEAAHTLSQDLAEWLGCLHATQMWFHSAHLVVSGTSFAGDHGVLYSRIYSELQESFDADLEKAIGVTQDEALGCPLKLAELALANLESFGSPCGMDAEAIAAAALGIARHHVAKVEALFEKLESEGVLTLGLNDHLAAQANTFESYVYLLQQRAQ